MFWLYNVPLEILKNPGIFGFWRKLTFYENIVDMYLFLDDIFFKLVYKVLEFLEIFAEYKGVY